MSDTLTLAGNSAVEQQGSVILPLRSGSLGEHDPLGFDAGDDNLYRFVGNDPVDETDPTGLQQKTGENKPTSSSLPTTDDVKKLSKQVIDELKDEKKKKGSLPKDPVTFPGYKGYDVGGPCAQYAERMTKLLKDRGIDTRVRIYDIPGDKDYEVQYTPPEGGKTQTVAVTAKRHVIVEVQTKSETLRLDAGVGVDEFRRPGASEGVLSSGNLGNAENGVIAKAYYSENLKISGVPEGGRRPQAKKGEPLLREVPYKP